MQLIYSPTSPFVRKVVVLLLETGLDNEVARVEVKTTALHPDVSLAASNPLKKLPALLRPDGHALYDSRVICRFLASKSDLELYPQGDLWSCLTLEATADGIMEAAVSMVYERLLRPEEQQYEPWVEAQWGKAIGAIEALEDLWIDALNEPLNMAHIAIGCALGYLDFRHEPRDWRSRAPKLATWFARFNQRASMQETVPRP